MSEHPLKRFKKFAPLGIGILAALFGLFVWPHGPLWAAVALILGWVVAQVVMFPKPGSPGIRRIGPGTQDVKALEGTGVDAGDLEKALKDAKSRQNQIQNEAFRITKPEVRKSIDGIADATGRIIEEVRRDPKDLRNAYQFFGYYLEASLKIIKRYGELAILPSPNEDEKAAMVRVEGELETIRLAFEKQLTMLRENDMIDLDVELTVLKKTIEMEGLGGK